MNLFDAIFKQNSPERTAILYERQQISYAELREQALAIGRALSVLGVQRGDRVALLLYDSPEFIAAFIAICSYGAIAVPINMSLRLEDQQAVLNDSTASRALVEEDLCTTLLQNQANKLPQLKQVICVGRGETRDSTRNEHRDDSAEALTQVLSFTNLMKQSAQRLPPAFPFPEQNQPAFILYTSGSTGEPKGAVHCQSHIFYTNETYCREVLRLKESDRLFSSSRLPFAYGLGNALTFPLLNGCTSIVCREKPTPEVIAEVFSKHKPTVFFGVPVVYRLLLDEFKRKPEGSTLDCSSLRLCISAGEALPAAIGEEWEKFFGVPVLDGIGSTEMLHMWMSNHEGDVVYGSSGKLLHGYEARLLDLEGQPIPDGAEGNLWIKGASAAGQYWQRPEVTADTFIEGWVRTGDLYRRDVDGYWFHMGRSDDCFKSSGQWVSPVEVEGVLQRHEGVRVAAVVEAFDDAGLPCANAFVVRSEASVDDSECELRLRELARIALPRFKQPRQYVFVNELPYTATGKIQRFKLREGLESKVQSLRSPSGE